MTPDELECYRKDIGLHIQEKFKEIDTNVSYIIVGSIGFFITMLEKFLDINTVHQIALMIVSLSLLAISFILFLFNKHRMAKNAEKLLEYIDEELLPHPTNSEKQQHLLTLWRDSDKQISKYRKWIYITLGTGIVIQMIFFTSNILLNNKEKKDAMPFIKIQTTQKDSAAINQFLSIKFDTSKSK